MAIKVTAAETLPDRVANATVRRYVRREDALRIGAGISSFDPLPEGTDPRSLWEAHDVPEVHYVLRGSGVLLEEDEEVVLAPGDLAITPAGRRHILWGIGDEPLVTVYVAR